MAKKIPQPDWSEWLSTPRVAVWQACALSVDIEPHSMSANRDGWMALEGAPFFDEGSFPSDDVAKEFEKRQRVLIANLSGDAFSAPVLNLTSPKRHELKLEEFARWAVKKVQWALPKALVDLASAMAIASPEETPDAVVEYERDQPPPDLPLEMTEEEERERERDQRLLVATFAETINNGHTINWRYWVLHMPSLTAAQAARLMSALDPDIFEDLGTRPNKSDPSRMCKRAKAMQRLAEAEKLTTAIPAGWLIWADERDLKVHDGFRLAVEELTRVRPQPDKSKSPRKTHSREDALTAVIEVALSRAPDSENASSVWAVLVKFAEEPERYPPMVGLAEGKIKIDTDNGVREFSKKNLRDRLTRRKEKLAKAR